MQNIWLYSLLGVLAVSLVSLIGILALSIHTERLKKALLYLVSFSAGGLLGDVFFHLLPELVKDGKFTITISLIILGGIIFCFIMEKFIVWHHCHKVGCEDHPHRLAWMNIFGDLVHNFIDGLIIAAGFLVSTKIGIATTLAVILHEIPQEIGDFGVLLHAGFSRMKALVTNFITALSSFIGVILALSLSSYSEAAATWLVPFAAGNFIYIACVDLIPELHKTPELKKSFFQLLTFILGLGIMALLLFIEL